MSGLALEGAWLAAAAPIVFSLTARRSWGERSGHLARDRLRVHCLHGPLLVGAVADLSSLRTSLLLPVAFSVGVAIAATSLPSATEEGEGHTGGRVCVQ